MFREAFSKNEVETVYTHYLFKRAEDLSSVAGAQGFTGITMICLWDLAAAEDEINGLIQFAPPVAMVTRENSIRFYIYIYIYILLIYTYYIERTVAGGKGKRIKI